MSIKKKLHWNDAYPPSSPYPPSKPEATLDVASDTHLFNVSLNEPLTPEQLALVKGVTGQLKVSVDDYDDHVIFYERFVTQEPNPAYSNAKARYELAMVKWKEACEAHKADLAQWKLWKAEQESKEQARIERQERSELKRLAKKYAAEV